MALRTTPNEYTLELWKLNSDYLATDVGDIALLTTNVTTSVVNSLNNLQSQINSIVVGAFSLNNNVWFTSLLFGGGSANLFRINTSNNLEFGRDISSINIIGGTITSLTSPMPIGAGGTGANTQFAARASLGLAIGTDVQAWDAQLDQIAALAPNLNNVIIGTGSAWVLATPAGFKTAMNLTIGTDVQAWSTRLDSISAITPNNDTFIAGNGSSWVSRTATDVRSILQLVVGTNVQAYNANLQNISNIGTPSNGSYIGSVSGIWSQRTPTQVKADLSLTPGSDIQAYSARLQEISSISPLSNTFLVANGTNIVGMIGSTARTAMGVAIGTDVQAWSTHLDAIANGSKTANNIIVANGTTYAVRTEAQFKSDLSLTVGTHVQAWDINLDQIAALTPSVNNILLGNGSAWVLSSGSSARAALGLAIGSDVQGWNTKLDQIAALTPSTNGILIWSGSAWVTQVGGTARTSLGVAASGANTDITSLFYSGGILSLKGLHISMEPANGVQTWRFVNDGSLRPSLGTCDVGASAEPARYVYSNKFYPTSRATDWNLTAFGYTRRVSLNPAAASTQQVAEFALSLAADVQFGGIIGGL